MRTWGYIGWIGAAAGAAMPRTSPDRYLRDYELRRPLTGLERIWSWETIATTSDWAGQAAFILEPNEIRVLSPLEAFDFWESWIRERRK